MDRSEAPPAHPWHMTWQQHVNLDDLYAPSHSNYSYVALVSKIQLIMSIPLVSSRTGAVFRWQSIP
jgi:hypothetical protein